MYTFSRKESRIKTVLTNTENKTMANKQNVLPFQDNEIEELAKTITKQIAWIRGAVSVEPNYLNMIKSLKENQIKLNVIIDAELKSSEYLLELYGK